MYKNKWHIDARIAILDGIHGKAIFKKY